jgi:hypothetical protein
MEKIIMSTLEFSFKPLLVTIAAAPATALSLPVAHLKQLVDSAATSPICQQQPWRDATEQHDDGNLNKTKDDHYGTGRRQKSIRILKFECL